MDTNRTTKTMANWFIRFSSQLIFDILQYFFLKSGWYTFFDWSHAHFVFSLTHPHCFFHWYTRLKNKNNSWERSAHSSSPFRMHLFLCIAYGVILRCCNTIHRWNKNSSPHFELKKQTNSFKQCQTYRNHKQNSWCR